MMYAVLVPIMIHPFGQIETEEEMNIIMNGHIMESMAFQDYLMVLL
jgi:hypothetical protein